MTEIPTEALDAAARDRIYAAAGRAMAAVSARPAASGSTEALQAAARETVAKAIYEAWHSSVPFEEQADDVRQEYLRAAGPAIAAAARYLIAEGRRQRDTELFAGTVEAWGSDPATAAAEIRQSATIMRPAAAARHRAIADGLEAGRLTPAQAWQQLDETPALMARYERELRAKIAGELDAESDRVHGLGGQYNLAVAVGLTAAARMLREEFDPAEADLIAEGTDHG